MRIDSCRRGLVNIAALPILCTLASVLPGQLKNYYKIVNRWTPSLVLDVQGASVMSNARIVVTTDTGAVSQQFEFVSTSAGGSMIVNRRSGYAIDIANGSFSDAAIIQQYPPHQGANQRWLVPLLPGGFVRLESVHTRKCLEACGQWNGAPVAQHTFTGHVSQYWRLVLVRNVVDFKLTNAASNKALGVPGFATADQTIIRQASYLGRPDQIWFLDSLGGQRNIFESRCSGKVMDIPGNNPANQVPIQQFTRHGGFNQQFDVLWAGNGLFKIAAPSTGKVFDIPFGAPIDGLQLQQVADNGGLNQRWKIEFAR